MKGWATDAEVQTWTRRRILDVNDLLDALEEAEENAKPKK